METTLAKKSTSFRLSEPLLNALKREARKANRSLSNYVECVLSDSVYREPNKETLEAMREAESVAELETLDLNNFKKYMASL
jgi:hypothetical protein